MSGSWRCLRDCRDVIGVAVIIVSVIVIASCAQNATPAPVASLPATWTPTVLPDASGLLTLERTPVSMMTPQPTTAPPADRAPLSKTSQALQPSTLRVSAPDVDAEAEDIPRGAPPQTRIVTPAPSSISGRIDVVGPVAVATVAPLPAGAGMPPTRLVIPALGLDTPVQTMGWKVIEDAKGVRSEWDVVDFAAGHHINSAFPGEPGNVVLSGHNNIGGAVFQSVCVIGEPGVDFGLGDEMILEDELGRRFIYQVNGWRRLKEANASIAKRQENAHYLDPTAFAQLTLVTCWPPTSNTHRVIVTGLLSGKE